MWRFLGKKLMADKFQKEIGVVRATKHYLLSVEGLPSARVHDILVTEEGGRALVTSLSHDAVEAMLLDRVEVRPGQLFELHDRTSQFSVGNHLFGRVINALGDPIDGKGAFPPKNTPLVLEREAGDLSSREAIVEQFVTGFSMIDTVLPIGKGQRQLIMGPIQSGTDSFCRQVIKNQAKQGTVCVYASIGKPMTYVRRFAQSVFEDKVAENVLILAGTAQDTTPLNVIAPSVALFIAEHFSQEGREVLLVFDDLYTHAKYLREVGLLEGRLPGRESYPGDIFYQQAHLIERAGCFTGRGSITLFPVLQTDIEATTDLIMTNIMGTTDGHLSFSSSMHAQGVFPPVSEEESVTRVGKHTQSVVQKQLSTAISSLLAEMKEQERFTQFGTQMSEGAQETIKMGQTLRVLLSQNEHEYLAPEVQAVLLGLVFTTFSDQHDATFFRKYSGKMIEIIQTAKLEPVRALVKTGGSLESFIAELEGQVPYMIRTCRT